MLHRLVAVLVGGAMAVAPLDAAADRGRGARVRIRTGEIRYEIDGDRYATLTGTGRTIVFGEDVTANEYSPVESVVVALGACSAISQTAAAT